MIRFSSFLLVMATAAVAVAADGGGKLTAKIINGSGVEIGTATFTETKKGVDVAIKVSGLPPGKHGMHIHENGKCETPRFATAGSHYNPDGKRHGSKNPAGKHVGDLPNLVVKSDGTARMTATVEGATLGTRGASLVKGGGTALVIHSQPDDEKTDPSGNSGDKIACGVIGGKQ